MLLNRSLFFILFLVSLCFLATGGDEAEDEAVGLSLKDIVSKNAKLINQLLKVAITYVLTVAKQDIKTIDLITDSKTMFNGTWLIVGLLQFQRTYVYGLDTMQFKVDTDYDINNSFRVNLTLDFDKIGINVTEYDADIGILDEIPLYGLGNINLGLSQATVDLDLNVSLNNYPVLKDVFINLRFRDAPIAVSGIWKSTYADDIFAGVLNVLKNLFTMFWAYENDCISCVLSTSAKSAIKNLLGATKGDPDYSSCPCGNKSSSGLYNLQNHIQPLADVLLRGNVEDLSTVFKSEDIEASLKTVVNYMKILINEQINNANYFSS